MFCITLETDDPFLNLAIEEVLLKNRKEDFLILGINSPSLIIGKHQSAHRESNTEFVTDNKIPVIRRISGGGTVYHDKGNLNFTFIRQSEPGKQIDFRKYTRPVIDFLSSKGVDAKFEGKNDLKVNGLKISGNAEHVHRSRVLHHGTLLFDTTLDILRNTIRKDTSCYTTRAVGSNPSSVANLKGMLSETSDIIWFREEMMNYFLGNLHDAEVYKLTDKDIDEAAVLAEAKYRTWEWNYAYGPEYRFVNKFEFRGEQIECKFIVQEGIIRECILKGTSVLTELESKLTGCRHMEQDLKKVFLAENIPDIDIFNLF